MKNILFLLVIFLNVFVFNKVFAETFAISNVDVFVKSITTGQVVSVKADDKGNFTAPVAEEKGIYNIFIGDENMIPVKIMAKNNIISGRIVILTNGSTTKDPLPTKIIKKNTKITKISTPTNKK